MRFCEQIPYAFVVIWCVTLNKITPLQFGVLTTVEMVTAMLVYIPVAYLADKNTKKPFVAVTFGFFTVFPLVLLFSHTFWMLVVAFVVRGLKEFGEPTRKALIMDLALEGKKGGHLRAVLPHPRYYCFDCGVWRGAAMECFSGRFHRRKDRCWAGIAAFLCVHCVSNH